MTVKVAIDLSLDRLFEYSVPEEFAKKLAVGQLLSVPFGRRTMRGFAMAVQPGGGSADGRQPESAGGYVLKPVGAIVDEVPYFTPALLELVETIARYTASPIESVLKAAVPAALFRHDIPEKSLFWVEPAAEPDPGTLEALPPKRKWLFENIVRLKGGWLNRLARELSTTPATIKALERSRLVTVEKRQMRREPVSLRNVLPSKPLPLNAGQSAALAEILDDSPSAARTILLHGATGSGKTEVYLQAIAECLKRGRGAIVMVPEIALTPQTVRRFASRFGQKVAVLHSALSAGERRDEWHRIRNGEALVVVGPRSAVFAPVRNLGLIVVDEEHETSYKQEDPPRYGARDAAVLRGRIEGAKTVLGSATPSLESWRNAVTGKYALVRMPHRAGAARPPAVKIVDMNEPDARGRIFSPTLIDALRMRLDAGEQSILFLNRRGYARSATCPSCGYVAECRECSVPYTYHKHDECLRCHICGRWEPPPAKCPECGKSPLDYKGIGTQRAESALKEIFPRAKILRMDADSTSGKDSHSDLLGRFRRHEADILLGTQMIAKGLDFPNVTLAAVLNADSALNMPDFRAGERTFQLISQVAGRAGRAELPGEVVVQTYNPDAQTIRFAASGDFDAFARAEMEVRRILDLPPFCHLCIVSLKGKKPAETEKWASHYAEVLKKIPDLSVGEATPFAIEKADGFYRWQVAVRSKRVSTVVGAWRWMISKCPVPKSIRAGIDIDAQIVM